MTKNITIENNAGNVYIGESPEFKVNSAINVLLNDLASTPFKFQRVQRTAPPKTIVKIQHNGIQSRKYIIKQYMDHSAAIEAAYEGIDSVILFGKQIVLQNLNDLYFSALDSVDIDYLFGEIDIDAIRENAIFILDFIIQKLKNTAFESKNAIEIKEQIEKGVNVIVAHAFIECIIFENPEK